MRFDTLIELFIIKDIAEIPDMEEADGLEAITSK